MSGSIMARNILQRWHGGGGMRRQPLLTAAKGMAATACDGW